MKIIPTRSGYFTPPNLRLNGLILALALGLTTLPLPSMAKMSNPTGGRIHGRAPDVTGTPAILMPDGVTHVTDNAQVLWTAKTSDFTLAPLTSELTYTDEDGDLPSGVGITLANPPEVTWTWKQGSTPLIDAQLSEPFQNNFADGTALKVYAKVSVDVASTSGMPNAQQRTHHIEFNVVVKAPLPKIYVNGTTFDIDAGFPKTGFVGANFQFYMNGTDASDNSRYRYTTNQPGWTTVSSAGEVSFTRMPTAAEKSVVISIKNTTGVGGERAYAFTPNVWFINRGNMKKQLDAALSECSNLSNGYALTRLNEVTDKNEWPPKIRKVDGRLWSEWGRLSNYGNGWIVQGEYILNEEYGRDFLMADTGGISRYGAMGVKGFIACSQAL